MSILLNKSGILTTVQDTGRNGFRRFGINPNGAMDAIALRLINALLGNAETEAALEMHFPAPAIFFEEAADFALGGADFAVKLNGAAIENWRIHHAREGSILKFEEISFGNRAYLSVKGGFKLERWLGSAGTNLKAQIGGFDGRKLASGDRLFFKQTTNNKRPSTNYKISHALIPFYSKFPTVRVVAGAEFDDLTAISGQNFVKNNYTITPNSDRMGFRLAGAPLYLLQEKELLSSAVNFGTIQLLPDGQMIVLMADHQTSGGYPRLANVIAMDLPLVAQLGAGDKIAFHLISVAEAENALLRFEKGLNIMKTALKFR